MAMKPIVDGEPPYLGVYTTTEIALANAEIAAGSMNYVTGSSLTREEDGAVLFLVGVGKLGSFTGLATANDVAGKVAYVDLADKTDPTKGTALVGYQGRTVRARLLELPSPTDAPWNASADGTSDNTTPLNAFVDPTTGAPAGEFPIGPYLTGKVVMTTGRTWKTKTFGKTRSGRTILRANGNLDRLIHFANLNTSGAGDSRHLNFVGFVFDGNNKTMSDALVAIEGAYQVEFEDCTFINCTGRVLRMRQVNEVTFTRCLFIDNDCSASEMVYFDTVGVDGGGAPVLNFNVNNVKWFNCHFENNKGTYFRTSPTANLDICVFVGCKFEYGSIPAGTAGWTLFDMVNCFGFFVGAGSSLTNFRTENNYSTIFKFSSASGELCQGGVIEATRIRGISGTTQLLNKGAGDNTKIGLGVSYQSVDGNKPLLPNTSKYEDTSLDIRNANGNDAGSASRETALLRGSISSHYTAFPGGLFVVDAGSRNPQGTVFSIAGTGAVLADLPLASVSGQPMGFRLSARVRTTGGTGQINAQIATTTLTAQTVGTSYATYTFDVSASQVATLGASGSDRFRLLSVGADTYFVDQVWVTPLPSADAGMVVPLGNATVPTGGTTTFVLPVATNPNKRAIYMLRGDANAAGMFALFEVSGSSPTWTLTNIVTSGALAAAATANPVTAGRLNAFIDASGNISVNNLTASDRRVCLYAFGLQ